MIQLHHYQETSCMHKITWSRVPRQNSRFSPFFGSLQTFQGHTEKNHKLQMLKYRHHFQGNESLVQTSREQNPVRYNALTRSTACWHVSYVERETKHTPWVMKVINTLRKEELDFPSLEVFKGRQDAFLEDVLRQRRSYEVPSRNELGNIYWPVIDEVHLI